MDTQTIISAIEAIAPLSSQANWDRSGLQVTAYRKTHKHLAVMLDPIPINLTSAIEIGCDCILSHHPLSLKPDLPNVINNYFKALHLLISADIPLYAAHTSLDTNLEGPASWLADELKMTDRRALEGIDRDNPLKGYGLVGSCGKWPPDEFLSRIAAILPVDTATIVGDIPDVITRCAYCTGSGASLIPNAEREKADIYITGDIKYHAALDADICIIDVGHHCLEEEMMRRTSKVLAETLHGLTVTFIPSRDPIRSFEDRLSNFPL